MTKNEVSNIIGSKVVKGGFWLFLLNFLTQTLAIIQNIIIPLFLIPEDLGIYQIILSSLGLFSVIFGLNSEAFLKQKKSDNIEDYLNVAWTYNIIKGIFLFIFVFSISQILATICNNQKIVIYVRFLAFSYLFNGFINLKIIYLERELEFKKLTFYNRISVPISCILLIIFLILNLNIWALFLSYITVSLYKLIASYIIYPKKLSFKFSLKKLKEIYNFQIWIYFSSLIIFAYHEGIYILIGLSFGLIALGLFKLSYNLAIMPTWQIATLVSDITFPAYSLIQDKKEEFRVLFLNVLKTLTFIIFFIGGIIFCLARDFILLFYGEKWYPAILLIQIFVFFGINRSIGNSSAVVMDALNKPKKNTYCVIIFTIIEYSLIILLMQFYDIIGVAWGILIASYILMFLFLNNVVKELNIHWISIIKLLIYPAIAFIAMIILNYFVHLYFDLKSNLINFLIFLVIAIITYLGIILFEMIFFDYSLKEILNEIRKLFYQ